MDSLTLATSLLNEAKIKYWIDQGTLLSIVRDGQLKTNFKLFGIKFDHDDIDISIFYEDLKKFEEVALKIVKNGYTLRKCFFRKKIFQYKFLPLNKLKLSTIDIKIYYDSKKDFYWSVKKAIKTPNNRIFHKINRIILSNWYWNSKSVYIDRFPLSLIFKALTWYLPKNIIDPIQYDHSNKINIPKNVDKYLSHHFGNWKQKRDDWKSYRDDKAIVHCHPDKLLNSKKF